MYDKYVSKTFILGNIDLNFQKMQHDSFGHELQKHNLS